jgi:hypothetical protein
MTNAVESGNTPELQADVMQKLSECKHQRRVG